MYVFVCVNFSSWKFSYLTCFWDNNDNHTNKYIRTYVYIYIYICTFIYLIYIYIYICMYIYIYIHLELYIYIYMYTTIYTYTYICIHTYRYIYIYMAYYRWCQLFVVMPLLQKQEACLRPRRFLGAVRGARGQSQALEGFGQACAQALRLCMLRWCHAS